MTIVKATIEDVDKIAPLFDLYRRFYEQPGDSQVARQYIHDRLNNDESIIFLALKDHKAVGFTQPYPSFCSVEMIKIFVLYDLYVTNETRGGGFARALLDAAKTQALSQGVKRIDLQTAHTNTQAQNLYRTYGYKYSDEFQNWSYYPA